MIEETEKVVWKRIESVYQEDSYSYAIIDNFRMQSFFCEEPKTLFDSGIAFYKYNNVD